MSVQALALAIDLQGLSPSEKLLLILLANYANEHMQSYPSHKTLAQKSGLTDRTILTLMKALEEKKLVSREVRRRLDGTRTTDLITLHFHGEIISVCTPHQPEIHNTINPKLTALGGETISPHEPRTNLKKKEPKETALLPFGSLPIPADLFPTAWLAYPNYGRSRSSKAKAKVAWCKAADLAGGDQNLSQAVARYAASPSAAEEGGKFVPAFERWLRDERWEHWLSAPAQPYGPTGADDWQ